MRACTCIEGEKETYTSSAARAPLPLHVYGRTLILGVDLQIEEEDLSVSPGDRKREDRRVFSSVCLPRRSPRIIYFPSAHTDDEDVEDEALTDVRCTYTRNSLPPTSFFSASYSGFSSVRLSSLCLVFSRPVLSRCFSTASVSPFLPRQHEQTKSLWQSTRTRPPLLSTSLPRLLRHCLFFLLQPCFLFSLSLLLLRLVVSYFPLAFDSTLHHECS